MGKGCTADRNGNGTAPTGCQGWAYGMCVANGLAFGIPMRGGGIFEVFCLYMIFFSRLYINRRKKRVTKLKEYIYANTSS
ncbi:hypothetical protein BDW02DRAFT_407806 [Decorospora gaudefroyi]|uniref:Uncharacterized protein n=1 Tax=Decorospora gaudefroyi TaxID=184978 RepID=A0A6A5KEB7_9PLEO|nr:hypothetical protein BDW02DRAFT_407806 [Decorospora gaudefroyi]